MKLVIFYEKPGCVTNAKQKKSLYDAGLIIIEKNLLEHGMSEEELLTYLEKKPIAEWFNPNAPMMKKKQIDPESFTKEEALTKLHNNPILIRRPLISVEGCRMCGFDKKKIEEILGISLDITKEEKCALEIACPSPITPSST